jgi:hypothetical protein
MDAGHVPATAMRGLVRSGEARPLLQGFEIVPTRYRDAWWHVPRDGEDYVPAGPELSAELDLLRARADLVEAFDRDAG